MLWKKRVGPIELVLGLEIHVEDGHRWWRCRRARPRVTGGGAETWSWRNNTRNRRGAINSRSAVIVSTNNEGFVRSRYDLVSGCIERNMLGSCHWFVGKKWKWFRGESAFLTSYCLFSTVHCRLSLTLPVDDGCQYSSRRNGMLVVQ